MAAMPAAQPPRGGRPNWGEDINRKRAFLIAQENDMNVSLTCPNCDADVFDFLSNQVKAADAFATDLRT